LGRGTGGRGRGLYECGGFTGRDEPELALRDLAAVALRVGDLGDFARMKMPPVLKTDGIGDGVDDADGHEDLLFGFEKWE
jgi:hypothetical protein